MNISEMVDTIRQRRKALGLDQRELARISKVSLHAIINLETGKGSPTMRTLLAVCEVLGLKLELTLKHI